MLDVSSKLFKKEKGNGKQTRVKSLVFSEIRPETNAVIL
jgi:hypothetical protein